MKDESTICEKMAKHGPKLTFILSDSFLIRVYIQTFGLLFLSTQLQMESFESKKIIERAQQNGRPVIIKYMKAKEDIKLYCTVSWVN